MSGPHGKALRSPSKRPLSISDRPQKRHNTQLRNISEAVLLTAAKPAAVITPEQYKHFCQHGYINFEGFFTWWSTSGITHIGKQELDIFRYYSKDDQLACHHSLLQQAAAMDIRFWLLQVILRPDHDAWLISKPAACQTAGMPYPRIEQITTQTSISIDGSTSEVSPDLDLDRLETLKQFAKKTGIWDDGPGKGFRLHNARSLQHFCHTWKKISHKSMSVFVSKNLQRSNLGMAIFPRFVVDQPPEKIREGGHFLPVTKRLRHSCPLSQAMIGLKKYDDVEVQTYMKEFLDPKNTVRFVQDFCEEMKEQTRVAWKDDTEIDEMLKERVAKTMKRRGARNDTHSEEVSSDEMSAYTVD